MSLNLSACRSTLNTQTGRRLLPVTAVWCTGTADKPLHLAAGQMITMFASAPDFRSLVGARTSRGLPGPGN